MRMAAYVPAMVSHAVDVSTVAVDIEERGNADAPSSEFQGTLATIVDMVTWQFSCFSHTVASLAGRKYRTF